MASLGLLSPEFPALTVDQHFRDIAALDVSFVQFDLRVAVGDTFPQSMTDELASSVNNAAEVSKISIAAVSGTCNMIHPDPDQREIGIQGLERLISYAPKLRTSTVTLCTGSRDPTNMWNHHPDNNTDKAWNDLLRSVERAVSRAEKSGVILGVETEVGNTINTVKKARRLLDEIGSSHLKIIMDGANIFQSGELPRMHEKLDEAFDLLGNDIVLAHAKDLDRDGEAGHVAAGFGNLDYPYYLRKLQDAAYEGAIILHALKPDIAAQCVSFVRSSAPAGYIQRR